MGIVEQGDPVFPPQPGSPHPVAWVITFSVILALSFLFGSLFPRPLGAAFPILVIVLGAVQWLRSEDGSRRRAEAGAALFAGVLGIGLAWAVSPYIDTAREAAKRASCQNNLKAIGAACREYGGSPPRLSVLYPAYLPDLKVFACPDSPEEAGPPDRIDEWTDYELASAGAEWLCRDKRNDLHLPGGRNVLYRDGRVQYVREPSPSATTPP